MAQNLYIGLGGFGTEVLLNIKKLFIDTYGNTPQSVSFFSIDTDSSIYQTSIQGKKKCNIRLEQSEYYHAFFASSMDAYMCHPENFTWLPPENIKALPKTKSSSTMVRSNGRFAYLQNEWAIKNGLRRTLSSLLFTNQVNSTVQANCVDIHIFTSTCGSTGSGMLIDTILDIKEILKKISINYRIHPWLVYPDVFSSNNISIIENRLNANSYCFLEELDYIYEYNYVQNGPITFGNKKITEPLFEFAYCINNKNKNGIKYDDRSDVAAVIAKSAYSIANSGYYRGFIDRTLIAKAGGVFDVCGKRAWASSVGYAEIIYDHKAVKQSRIHYVIKHLTEHILKPYDISTKRIQRFEEIEQLNMKNMEDNIFKPIISDRIICDFEITYSTEEKDILDYFREEKAYIDNMLQIALSNKRKQINAYFPKMYMDLLQVAGYGINNLIDNFKCISYIILNEIKNSREELERLQTANIKYILWPLLLDSTKNKGIKAIFSKLNKKALKKVKDIINEQYSFIMRKCFYENLLNFYYSFNDDIHQTIDKIEKQKLSFLDIEHESMRTNYAEQIIFEYNKPYKTNLHINDVFNSNIDVKNWTDNNYGDFVKNLSLATEPSRMKELVWDFAQNCPLVKTVHETGIEGYLISLPAEKVKDTCSRLENVACPMWALDLKGYATNDVITTYTNVCMPYDMLFKNSVNHLFPQAQFEGSKNKDRMSMFVFGFYTPIFAVERCSAYQEDYDNAKNNFNLSCFVDENLKRLIAN